MSQKRSTQLKHRSVVDRATAYIAENIDQPLDLTTLANVVGLSPHYFQRIFREALSESPKQFVRRVRLERSQFLLRQPGVSVTDVAFNSAYETHESFTRAFHAHFGESPRTFQRQADGQRRETTSPFEVVLLGNTRLATVPFVGPYDDDKRAFATLADWAAPRGLLEKQNVLGIYRDDQTVTDPTKTRGEAALAIADDVVVPPSSGVRVRHLEGGHYALVHHDGSNGTVRDTYDRVFRDWFPSSGWQPDVRPMVTEYHRDTDPLEASLFVSIKHSR